MIASTALLCLALNIYHESRGEPPPGQTAVAMVTLNRAQKDERKVCAEVFQPGQMSWTTGTVRKTPAGWEITGSAKPKDKAAWAGSVGVASDALSGRVQDNTHGATHFHSKHAKPAWVKKARRTVRIGNHFFYSLD